MSVIWEIYFSVTGFTEREVNISNPVIAHACPFLAISVYCLMLKFLPPYLLKKRGSSQENKENEENVNKKLSKLDWIIFFHNLFLFIISTMGTILAVVFEYIPILFVRGLFGSLCDEEGFIPKTRSPLNFWAFVFVWLKFYELLDTFFLIYKKPSRKVNFLHWFHHITVLLFTYYAFYYELSVGYMFAGVNLCVHSFMYYYYAATTLGKKPSWGWYLTIFQIFQMFWGIGVVSVFSIFYFSSGKCYCNGNPILFILYAYFMYGSYLYLFVKFFIKRYYSKKKVVSVDNQVDSKV